MKFLRFSLFLFIIIFVSTAVRGQYYSVNDKEGFVNVRETPGTDGKIICQLDNGTVISAHYRNDSLHKNWIPVQFYISREQAKNVKSKPEDWMPGVMKGYLLFTGYIYDDRLVNIEDGKELKKKWSGDDFLLFNDSIEVRFTPANFH